MRAARGPLVIGHRGASGYRPEHTQAAYELAFALGADAVEPDVVATRDGVLVVRHENEISGTSDVARHPEFAARRTTKEVDGVTLTGWFTEDFTWAELTTLRARERLPAERQHSATFDGAYPILRLRDVLEIVDAASDRADRPLGAVVELKHATYFASIGLALDELLMGELAESGWREHPTLIVESFEKTVLTQLHQRGLRSERVYLIEAEGAPADRVAVDGAGAMPYSAEITEGGLYGLRGGPPDQRVDGISLDARMLGGAGDDGETAQSGIVDRAHAAGLHVFAWTLRPENRFLPPAFRGDGRMDEWGDWRAVYSWVLESGVDGVFADHPDLVLSLR